MMKTQHHDPANGSRPSTRKLAGSRCWKPWRIAWALVCVLLSCVRALAAEPSGGAQATPAASHPGPAIEKAFISFRIGVPQWMP